MEKEIINAENASLPSMCFDNVLAALNNAGLDSLDGHNAKEVVSMAAAAYRLIRDGMTEEEARKIITCVKEIEKYSYEPLAFEERVEAFVGCSINLDDLLFSDEEHAKNPRKDIDGLAALDDQTLAEKIDRFCMENRAQSVSDYYD